MPRPRATWITLFAVIATVVLFGGRRAGAAEPAAAELLPASSVLYVEVEKPRDLIGLLLDHPLRKKLEESPDYQKAWENPKLKELRGALAALEKRSGVPWRKALEATTGGGVALAFDAKTQGIVMLLRADDRKTADAVRDALLGLVRDDAAVKGKPDPFVVQNYRGLTAYKAGDSLVGNLGNWTVVSNKEDLAKSIADAFLDAAKADMAETLAGDKEFIDARRDGQDDAARPTAWAFVRLGPLRMMAGANPLFDKTVKSEDPGAELILGGLVGPLRNAPYATASLTLDKQKMKLSVSTPNNPKWLPEERKFFFAPAGSGDGGAAAPLRPRGTILSLSAYRDLAAWWAAAPDLLSEGAAAKMAQADSGLSTFLGGKRFGTDVLGALRPQIDFIVASQDFKAAGVPEPGIKLPAFAMAFRLKEKQAANAQLRKHFRVAFQSLVALGNLDGSAKGRPMLTMNNERRGKAEILSAEYDPDAMMDADEKPDEDAANPEDDAAEPKSDDAKGKPDGADVAQAEQGIHYNVSPALVISKDHLIFCSTRQIARELADLAAREGSADTLKKLPQNTLVEVSARPVAELLKANREQLVAKNVLEKGHDREAAEKEVDLLLKLVGAVRDAKLGLTPTDQTMTLELEINAEPVK